MVNLRFDEESKEQIDLFAREMGSTWIGRRCVDEFDSTSAKKIIYSLFRNPELNIEKRMEEIIKSGEMPVNTYPFGNKTDEIYPQWIGVYHEITKQIGLKKMLKNIKCYCEHKNTVSDRSKEVYILTDIWNGKFEEEIVKSLLSFFKYDNVCVRIFLYNDYGVTIIPFFMSYPGWERLKNVELLNENQKQSFDENLLKELCSNPITYEFMYFSTWNMPGNTYDRYRIYLEFDGSGAYSKNNCKIISLEKQDIETFVRTISYLKKQILNYTKHDDIVTMDTQIEEQVKILGKSLSWKMEPTSLEESVAKAIRKLCNI